MMAKRKIVGYLITVCLVLTGILVVTPNVMAGKNTNHVNPLPLENGYQHDYWMPFHLGVTDYIEWWYFKLTKVEVGEETNINFIFAYIIVNPDDTFGVKENTGAYVATGLYYDEDTQDNGNGDMVFALDKYSLSDLSPAPKKEYLKVYIDNPNNYAITTDPPDSLPPGPGNNVHLVGDIRQSAIVSGTVDGIPFVLNDWFWDLTFTRNVGWTAMYNNEYAFPWEIYMMDAEVSGSVTINGNEYTVDHDWLGYQDHNWGQPFPRQWMWGQASFSTDTNIQDSEMSLVVGTGVMGVLPYGNLPAVYIALDDDGDFYEWSTEQADIASFSFDDWYRYEEGADSWKVPKYYTATIMDALNDPERYKLDVNLYAREDIIQRLPIPKQDSTGAFNDFQSQGVPAEIILSQWDDISSEWVEVKRWSYNDPSMVQLSGGAEYGIDSILPDLIIEDIWAPGPLPGPISASVKNQGTNTVTDFWVSFYDSGYSGMGSDIYLAVMTPLTPQHVGITLYPGQSTIVTTTWTSPPYGGGGSGDFIYVIADKYDTVTDPQEIEDALSDRVLELEENNNGLGYDPQNDEIIPYVSESIVPFVGIDVNFQIINPTSSMKTVFLTQDQLTVPSDWDIGLYDSLDNPISNVLLRPFESTVVTLKITPSIITSEDYYVKVIADWEDKSTENMSCDYIIVHLIAGP